MDRIRLPGDPDMAVDGAALLGEARHVEHSATLLFEVCRHAEKRPNCYDPRPAYAGNENAVGLIKTRENGFGQLGQSVLTTLNGVWLPQLTAMYGNKARAET